MSEGEYVYSALISDLLALILDLIKTLYLIFDYPYKYYTFKHFEV